MLNDKVIADIKKVFPFVNELGDKEDQFFNMLYHKKLGPDMVLLDEDKSCSGVVLVLSGTIRIYKLSEDGKEIICFALAGRNLCSHKAVSWAGDTLLSSCYRTSIRNCFDTS